MKPTVRAALRTAGALLATAVTALTVPIALGDEILDDLLASNPGRGPLAGWKAFADLRHAWFTESSSAGDEQTVLCAEAELDFHWSDAFEGYLRPRVFAEESRGGEARIQFPEAHLTYRAERWDLRGGILVEDWGIADTFNPVDVLNPRDFATDLLDPLKLGQAGVRFRRFLSGGRVLGEPTLSIYYMPVFEATRFAPPGHLLYSGSPSSEISHRDAIQPRGSARTFWALRFQGTLDGSLAGADLQLAASRGPDRSPSIRPLESGRLSPIYQNVTTTALGLRAVPEESRFGHFLSTLTLKLEVAHRSFSRYDHSPFEASENYWVYVVGVDRELPNLLRSRDALTLTLEYVAEESAGADSRQRPFQHDVIFRLLWQAGDLARSTVQLRGVLDPRDDESLLEASFETRLNVLSEDLRLQLRWRHVEARQAANTPFAALDDAGTVSLSLRWDFAG